jgi:hypothetical protein
VQYESPLANLQMQADLGRHLFGERHAPQRQLPSRLSFSSSGTAALVIIRRNQHGIRRGAPKACAGNGDEPLEGRALAPRRQGWPGWRPWPSCGRLAHRSRLLPDVDRTQIGCCRFRAALHKVSRRIMSVRPIAVEDLNGLAAGMHAKHVNDAAWLNVGLIRQPIHGKANAIRPT